MGPSSPAPLQLHRTRAAVSDSVRYIIDLKINTKEWRHLPPGCVEFYEQVIVLGNRFIEVIICQYKHTIFIHILYSERSMGHETEGHRGEGLELLEVHLRSL